MQRRGLGHASRVYCNVSRICFQFRQRVRTAQAIQRERYDGMWRNGNAPEDILEETARLSNSAKSLMNTIDRESGSDTAVQFLRVTRTLADLNSQKTVTPVLIDTAWTHLTGTRYGVL